MDSLSKAYKNLLVSAYGASGSELWRATVVSIARYWWAVPLTGLIVGLVVGIRKRREPGGWYRATQTAVAVVAAALGSWGTIEFGRGPSGIWAVAGVVISAVLLPLVPGVELGMVMRKSRSARWYLGILLIVAFVSWLAAALIGGPVERMTKQELKQMFRDATGRDASAEEKEGFWGHAVGDEAPTEPQKNEYWRNR